MRETLTRSESQQVINDLKANINRITNSITNKNLFGETIDILDEKRQNLQDALNRILSKGGIITEEDYNDAYEQIRKAAEKRIRTEKQQRTRNLIIGIGVIAIVIAGLYYIRNKKG